MVRWGLRRQQVRVSMPAGSNDCWQNYSSSCGSETRLGARANAVASRRRTVKMRSIF
jgi:hypothetical protein